MVLVSGSNPGWFRTKTEKQIPIASPCLHSQFKASRAGVFGLVSV